MIGGFLRHPSRYRPVPRPQFNVMTRALSASATNVDFQRTSYSPTSAPIPPLNDSTCDSVISCPDVVKVPKRVGQIQSTQSLDDVLPLVPRRPEPQILMRTWIPVEERPIRPPYTQIPVFHATPYQEQHIPVHEPQLTVPAPSNAPEVLMDCSQPLPDSTAFQQQQLSEDMDIDFECPQSHIYGPEKHASSTHSQYTNAVSGFSFSGRSFSYGPPVLQCTGAPLATDRREELPLPPLQESFPVSSRASEWTSLYPRPATMTHVCQPHIIQPLQDANAPETFSFNIHPDTATPHFDFSQQLASVTPMYSGRAEYTLTGDMSLDENHMLQSSVDHVPTQLIEQKQDVRQAQTPPISSSDHQPKVVPRPSSPVDTVKAKGEMTL
jgi:hypothetical protein